MKVFYAIRAFWFILLEKDHLYVDIKKYSITGNRQFIKENTDLIITVWNDKINQENVLSEAKEILK